MKINLIVVFLLLTNAICVSQNLIPNGDFEQHTGCPNNPNQLSLAPPWINPVSSPPTVSTPDYFNQCSSSSLYSVPTNVQGYQSAHSGNAYTGIVLWSSFISHHEFIEAPLLDQLIADSCYYFEMYVCISNSSNYTTNNLGIYFSDTIVTGYTSFQPLPFVPQVINQNGYITDTLNWTLISGSYTAIGGENFIIIGNYNNDQTTNLLQIDTSQYDFVYFYVDDILLVLTSCTGINEQMSKANVIFYPNPCNEEIIFESFNNHAAELVIYDTYSRKQFYTSFNNKISINTSKFSKGIYLYQVNIGNSMINSGKFIKD